MSDLWDVFVYGLFGFAFITDLNLLVIGCLRFFRSDTDGLFGERFSIFVLRKLAGIVIAATLVVIYRLEILGPIWVLTLSALLVIPEFYYLLLRDANAESSKGNVVGTPEAGE